MKRPTLFLTGRGSVQGLILSENGLYENAVDDAINVHSYLQTELEKIDHTRGQYFHAQSRVGFRWGEVGDNVTIIFTLMEIVGNLAAKSIHAADKPINKGVKVWITFATLCRSQNIDRNRKNLTWTPGGFTNNIVRNNRRGRLFSTPRHIVAENNCSTIPLAHAIAGAAIATAGMRRVPVTTSPSGQPASKRTHQYVPVHQCYYFDLS